MCSENQYLYFYNYFFSKQLVFLFLTIVMFIEFRLNVSPFSHLMTHLAIKCILTLFSMLYKLLNTMNLLRSYDKE